MDVLTALVVGGIGFGRTAIGLVTRPYETYRRIVSYSRISELVFVGLFAGIYFAFASMVKGAAFRPFLFTRQFIVLYAAAAGGYGIAIGSLWLAGVVLRATFHLRALFLAWGYTLLPTVAWFLATSLLYVILPPPRTTSTLGIAFSILFLIFSATLFWWKMMLSYLTLRFVFKFDLSRIGMASMIVLPIMAAYSVLMYYWGIFKIPFL